MGIPWSWPNDISSRSRPRHTTSKIRIRTIISHCHVGSGYFTRLLFMTLGCVMTLTKGYISLYSMSQCTGSPLLSWNWRIFNAIIVNLPRVRHFLIPSEKGRDLTQSYMTKAPRFLELAMSLLDFSPWIPLGTFSLFALQQQKCQKDIVTTRTTPQKSSITLRLRTDLGLSVGVTTAI